MYKDILAKVTNNVELTAEDTPGGPVSEAKAECDIKA